MERKGSLRRLVTEKPDLLAVLLVVILQLAGGIWWTSKLDSRIGSLEEWKYQRAVREERFVRIEERADTLSKAVETILIGIQRMEGKMDGLQKTMFMHIGERSKNGKDVE